MEHDATKCPACAQADQIAFASDIGLHDAGRMPRDPSCRNKRNRRQDAQAERLLGGMPTKYKPIGKRAKKQMLDEILASVQREYTMPNAGSMTPEQRAKMEASNQEIIERIYKRFRYDPVAQEAAEAKKEGR